MKKFLFPSIIATLIASVSYGDIVVSSTDASAPTSISSIGSNPFNFVNGSEDNSDVYGTLSNRINAAGSIITIAKNVHLDFTHGNSQIWSGLTMAEGSSINLTKSTGALRLQANTANIEGDITINGFKKTSDYYFGGDNYAFHISGITANFKGNSNLTQLGVSGAYNDFSRSMNRVSGTLHVNTTGKLKFDDYLYFHSTTIKLDSSNSLISGAGIEKNATNVAAGLTNATSQADSTFYFVNGYGDTSYELRRCEAVINSFVANEFGTFNVYSGSALKLISDSLTDGESAFKVNKINIFTENATTEGATSMNSDLSLTLQLNFYEENGNNLYIGNIEELIGLANVTFQVYNHSLLQYEEGVLGENFFINDGWISRTAEVPEPAEWAMIFGAIALAFVAYRKR